MGQELCFHFSFFINLCRTAYRSRLAGYASDIGYTYVSVCCAGYQGVPPNCKGIIQFKWYIWW